MPKNVLIVEDDRVSRESLAQLLCALGHNVCAVWSAEEAKDVIRDFIPNIALLDVRLPGLPGDAFAVYLLAKCPETKVIFISGELRLSEPERFGPDVDFIPKPLDFNRLLHAMQA